MRRSWPLLSLLLPLCLAPPAAARADLETAREAYRDEDYAAALAALQPLAEAGQPGAQFLLGRMHARGEGVLQDFVQAHKWLNLAASQGHRGARALRDQVAERMTPGQLAAAQDAARAWEPARTEPEPIAEPAAPPPVAEIQDALNRLGYDAGPVDGLMGRRTAGAIRRFESEYGLPASGRPSPELLGALKQALAERAPPEERRREGIAGDIEDLAAEGEDRRAADRWVFYELEDTAEEATLPAERGGASEAQTLDRLRDLVRAAEERRAADLWFADAIRALIARHEPPIWVPVVEEGFRDGDYSRNPAWQVAAGRFRVEPGVGLRTVVVTRDQGRPLAVEELPQAILGTVLEEALRRGTGGAQAPEGPAVPRDYAEIYLPRTITNAFSIRVGLRVARGGILEFGPFAGAERGIGYRLAFSEGSDRGVELLRLTERGSSVVQSAGRPVELGGGAVHWIEWERDQAGEMVVSLDGVELIRAADRRVEGIFQGFTIVNRGGDYGIAQVDISNRARR